MKAVSPDSAAPGLARSARFHRWRGRKDKLARWLIGVGGTSVILAMMLIFFYLLAAVAPLFTPASAELVRTGSRPDWATTDPVYLAIADVIEDWFTDAAADFLGPGSRRRKDARRLDSQKASAIPPRRR